MAHTFTVYKAIPQDSQARLADGRDKVGVQLSTLSLLARPALHASRCVVLEGLEAPDADWILRLGHLQQREKCRVVDIIVKHDHAAGAAIEYMLTQKYNHSVFWPLRRRSLTPTIGLPIVMLWDRCSLKR